MNLLPNNLRDSRCEALSRPHCIPNPKWALYPVLVLLAAFIAMPAAGQENKPQPAAEKSGCSANAKAPEAWKPDASESTKDSKPLGPRWYLESNEVVLDPIWRGEQIACSFDIQNRGDADLTIQAKGG